jgi:hypothetical protein
MSSEHPIAFTPDQEAYLNAWSMVYIDAQIQQTLAITLSQFLINPGKYLFLAWLTAPHYVTTTLLPKKVAACKRGHQRKTDEDE